MEKSNNFKLKKILEYGNNQYLLVCSTNNTEEKIMVEITSESPIFGVTFPDDFMFKMRNFPPPVVPEVVKKIKQYHDSVKAEQKFSNELQAA
jgi:hypothetical protein